MAILPPSCRNCFPLMPIGICDHTIFLRALMQINVYRGQRRDVYRGQRRDAASQFNEEEHRASLSANRRRSDPYFGNRVACSHRGESSAYTSGGRRGQPHRKSCNLLLRRWLARTRPLRMRLCAPTRRRLARSSGGTPRGRAKASSRGSSRGSSGPRSTDNPHPLAAPVNAMKLSRSV